LGAVQCERGDDFEARAMKKEGNNVG
jgi:hypothetical protein